MKERLEKITGFPYDQVYQKVFDLRIEWGDHWEHIVTERIKKIYPGISEKEIEELDNECKQIQRFGNELLDTQGKSAISKEEFTRDLIVRYPSLSLQNAEKLFSKKRSKSPVKKYSPEEKNTFRYVRPAVSFFKNLLLKANLFF